MSQSGPRNQASDQPTPDLNVSTKVLRMEPGLFGLSLVPPEGGAGGIATALSGARACLPPGPPGRREAVSVSTVRSDGWLMTGDEPMIIRVASGGAEVLLTIYWPAAAMSGPPALRLMRLGAEAGPAPTGGGPPPPVPSPAAPSPFAGPFGAGGSPIQPMGATYGPSGLTPATGGQTVSGGMSGFGNAARPAAAGMPGEGPGDMRGDSSADTRLTGNQAEIVAHVEQVGDVEGAIGDWIGRRGSGRSIEGFELVPRGGLSTADFESRALLGRDWFSPWVPGGRFCGSRGLALPLRGFSVRLRQGAAARYELLVSARFVDGAEIGPIPADSLCAAPSLAPLEAFQLILRPRAG